MPGDCYSPIYDETPSTRRCTCSCNKPKVLVYSPEELARYRERDRREKARLRKLKWYQKLDWDYIVICILLLSPFAILIYMAFWG